MSLIIAYLPAWLAIRGVWVSDTEGRNYLFILLVAAPKPSALGLPAHDIPSALTSDEGYAHHLLSVPVHTNGPTTVPSRHSAPVLGASTEETKRAQHVSYVTAGRSGTTWIDLQLDWR